MYLLFIGFRTYMWYLLLEKGRKNRLFVLKTGYNDFLMDYVGKSQNQVLMYNKENVSLSPVPLDLQS